MVRPVAGVHDLRERGIGIKTLSDLIPIGTTDDSPMAEIAVAQLALFARMERARTPVGGHPGPPVTPPVPRITAALRRHPDYGDRDTDPDVRGAGQHATGVRLELAAQGMLLTGLLLGAADTDMMAGFDVEKTDPAVIARRALGGIEAGVIEVVADEGHRPDQGRLAGNPRQLYPAVV